METLDLFKDWTPEMIEALKHQRFCSEETRERLSEATKKTWSNKNQEEREEWGRVSSENNKRYWGGLSEERREELRRKNSESHIGIYPSEETRKRLSEARMGHVVSEETKRKISEAQLGVPKPPLSEEHKRAISEAIMGSTLPPFSEEHRRNLSESHMGKGHPQSEEARRSISASHKKRWADMSPEGVKEWGRSHHISPNMPEIFLDSYLQRNFPGEWIYTGDYSQGIKIGGRIPDWFNINGKKEVISEMGGLGIYHFLDDEMEEIAHYAKYGFRCIVVWEWDCYLPEELDRIFKDKVES